MNCKVGCKVFKRSYSFDIIGKICIKEITYFISTKHCSCLKFEHILTVMYTIKVIFLLDFLPGKNRVGNSHFRSFALRYFSQNRSN